MPFKPVYYLRDGKVDFINKITSGDRKRLTGWVRESPHKKAVIKNSFPKLTKAWPNFCFDIIYDDPEYVSEAHDLFRVEFLTPQILERILDKSPLGDLILEEYLNSLLSPNAHSDLFDIIVKHAFNSKNENLLYKLSRYPDLHIRFLFMVYLIENHPELIDTIYFDITQFTTSFTHEQYEQLTFLPKLMAVKDISKLAVLLLVKNRKEDYIKLKDFIYENYDYNYLASELLGYKTSDNDKSVKIKSQAFQNDADSLFATSKDYRLDIYINHKNLVSRPLIDAFGNHIQRFNGDEGIGKLGKIYICGLGPLLEKWTDKYMDLSKSKEYGFIGSGTTCSCFRIGDYVIKLVSFKWSYEDTICPNLYLIAKNYEEIYLRDSRNIVEAGLEVQKYLSRSATDIDPKYFGFFDSELARLGYRRNDTLTKGACGENTMLLDTYRDADCDDPEKLPDWFKECPLVLVDRDMVYDRKKRYVKQLSSGRYF